MTTEKIKKKEPTPDYDGMVLILRDDKKFMRLKRKSTKIKYLVDNYDLEKEEASVLVEMVEADKKKRKFLQDKESIELNPVEFQQIQARLLVIKEKQKQYSVLADYIMENNVIKTDNYTKDMYMYNESEGIFEHKAEVRLRELIDFINPLFSSQAKTEIISKIKDRTQFSIYNFNQKNLVGYNNGVFDLDTFETLPFSPDHLLTRKIPVNFDPKANSEILDKFMDEITDNNQDMIDSLYEYLADCFNNHYRSQKIHLLVGKGRNGKGTFMRLSVAFLGGDNVSNLNLHQLGNRFMTARMFGKFANICGDNSPNKLHYTGVIKNLRGQDRITADRKGIEAIKFENSAKIMAGMQEIPTTAETSDGWYRSFFIYNFTKTFPNSNFEETLITPETLSALLNKVIIAYKRFKKNNWNFTWQKQYSTMDQQRVAYDFGSNNVKAFWEYWCKPQQGSEVPKHEVYAHYLKFCEQYNLTPKGEALFGKELKKYAQGVRTSRIRTDQGRIYHWTNIELSQVVQPTHAFTITPNNFVSISHNSKTLDHLDHLDHPTTLSPKALEAEAIAIKFLNDCVEQKADRDDLVKLLIDKGYSKTNAQIVIEQLESDGRLFEPTFGEIALP